MSWDADSAKPLRVGVRLTVTPSVNLTAWWGMAASYATGVATGEVDMDDHAEAANFF